MSSTQWLEQSMGGKVHDLPAPAPLKVVATVIDGEWRTPIGFDLHDAEDQLALLRILQHNIAAGRRVELRR